MAPKVFRPSFWYWDCGEETPNRESSNGESPSSSSRERTGVVVVLGWMLSRRKHVSPYVRLYKSCGWDSLVCHPQVFNLFFPSKATALALSVLDELAKSLEENPVPVVFVVFSGGHKACLYKIIQILLGRSDEVNNDLGRFELVRRCLAGLMFDSSPLDFVSYLGARFVSHQVLTPQPGRPIPVVSWGAYAVGKGLDAIFHRSFTPQRFDLWESLYSIVKVGPVLLLCSENDELAPVETIKMYASNLSKLGGSVNMVVWKESEHVGHFRLHPDEYAGAVRKFFAEVSMTYLKLESCAEGSSISEQSVPLKEPSAARWTNLPESIAMQIRHLSRLPHVDFKDRDKNEQEDFTCANACHGAEMQACSNSIAVGFAGSMLRSKL